MNAEATESTRARAAWGRLAGPLADLRPTSTGIRRAVTIAGIVMIGTIGDSSNVFACPQCFGAEESSLIDGAKLGVAVLLAITLTVQGGFAAFFLYLRKRAKRHAELELDAEWSELQRGSRTS